MLGLNNPFVQLVAIVVLSGIIYLAILRLFFKEKRKELVLAKEILADAQCHREDAIKYLKDALAAREQAKNFLQEAIIVRAEAREEYLRASAVIQGQEPEEPNVH